MGGLAVASSPSYYPEGNTAKSGDDAKRVTNKILGALTDGVPISIGANVNPTFYPEGHTGKPNDDQLRVLQKILGLLHDGITITSGGTVSWGGIGGNLSSQTDLQSALNGKVNLLDDQTVAGTKTFSNSLIIGNGGLHTYTLLGASQSSHTPANTTDQLYSGSSTTGTTESRRSIMAVSQYEGSSTSAFSMIGMSGTGATKASAAGGLNQTTTGGNGAGLIGLKGNAYHFGTGTVAEAAGVLGNIENTFGVNSPITVAADFDAKSPTVSAASTWGSMAGLWVHGGAISGTITNRYGVYVESLTGGTNLWGIYVATDPSYFGGNVTVAGLLKTGSTPVTLTDSTGKTVPGTATGIQAWSSNLDTWSGKTPFAGSLSITTGKTETVTDNITLSSDGTGTRTLNIASGGTLGSNAFTSTSFQAALSTDGSISLSSNALSRPALTGDVTASAGSNATSIIAPNGLPIAAISKKATDATAILPIILYAKNVSILTSGTPADIATIPVPAGITRFRLGSAVAATALSEVYFETLSGIATSANFTAWDAAGGTGVQLQGSAVGSTSPGGFSWGAAAANVISTSSTIFIRQTSASLNAGTASFYIVIFPIP